MRKTFLSHKFENNFDQRGPACALWGNFQQNHKQLHYLSGQVTVTLFFKALRDPPTFTLLLCELADHKLTYLLKYTLNVHLSTLNTHTVDQIHIMCNCPLWPVAVLASSVISASKETESQQPAPKTT